MPKNRSYRQTERIIKGFANHRRLAILELLNKEPELSVAEISEKLDINFKTASEHIRRLAIAGLVLKRSDSKCPPPLNRPRQNYSQILENIGIVFDGFGANRLSNSTPRRR